MKVLVSLCLVLFLLFGCEQSPVEKSSPANGESALSRKERITELEQNLEVAAWENARLNLKLRAVDGRSLVRDKKTGLWHYDVEREPYTGRAFESFSDGMPRAEAHFLKGRKDGMERFWHANGNLAREGQWFDNLANGLMRNWDEKGRLIKAERYKNGELIEVLLQ